LQTTPRSPKSSAPPQQDAAREQNQEAFRQYLRQADKYILERQFDKARDQIEQARKLFPQNPFIIAFEERLSVFENKDTLQAPLHSPGVLPHDEKISDLPVPPITVTEELQETRERLEKRIRQEVEAEYKLRFTEELHKAEASSTTSLQEEREVFERQQHTLKEKYDQQMKEALEAAKNTFARDLDTEILNAEQNLKTQHEAEMALLETEMKNELMKQYQHDLQEKEEQFHREKEVLQEKERNAFHAREQDIQEEFNRKLTEGLQKTEELFQEKSIRQQKAEQDKLRTELTANFQETLARERGAAKKLYEELKSSLESNYRAKEEKARIQFEKKLNERLNQSLKNAAEEFEVKRIELHRTLEAEFEEKLKTRVEKERERIQSEAHTDVENERKKLQEQYDILLREQDEKIQKIRAELSKEKEKVFLQRLERIAREYENKMELLGANIPAAKTERLALYRDKIRPYYVNGQPSVDEARRVMQLKELLGLTFDEHLTVETDVRLDRYVECVEKKILSGEIGTGESEILDNLKRQFSISYDETARLEPYILSSLRKATSKGRILVVDDEAMLLESIADLLTENGFQVATAADVKSALDLLATSEFDLILSDIRFGVEELDGFKFFGSLQDDPRLRKIPFVFMSSLKDGVIVRSGLQLGVDDYLTKPVDPDILVAVIEGKLKRFRKSRKT
jgi:CheY-like chemotaxis protein